MPVPYCYDVNFIALHFYCVGDTGLEFQPLLWYRSAALEIWVGNEINNKSAAMFCMMIASFLEFGCHSCIHLVHVAMQLGCG